MTIEIKKENEITSEEELDLVSFGAYDLDVLNCLTKEDIYTWFEEAPHTVSNMVMMQMALVFKRAVECNLSPKDKAFWDIEQTKEHWKGYAINWWGASSFMDFVFGFIEVWKHEKRYFYKDDEVGAANYKEFAREKLKEGGLNPDQVFIIFDPSISEKNSFFLRET